MKKLRFYLTAVVAGIVLFAAGCGNNIVDGGNAGEDVSGGGNGGNGGNNAAKDERAPLLSAGSVLTRASDTAAAIGFTTDEAGTAYYLTAETDAITPTSVDVKTDGVSLGAVSGTVDGKDIILTASTRYIYVVVEDKSRNVSAPLRITTAYLSAEVFITPNSNVVINTPLTANHSGDNATYQWYRINESVVDGEIKYDTVTINGAISKQYRPNETGTYTVTVSVPGYNSRTADAVNVTDPPLPTLYGDVTISPTGPQQTGTELTATYSGTETVSYQWYRDGTEIPKATSNKYKPTEAGSYYVTVSAKNYTGQTSPVVTVTYPYLASVTITPTSPQQTGTELTADYSGTETVSYQWYKDGAEIPKATSNKYTPTEDGSYHVTVSAKNYIGQTSPAVDVTCPDGLTGNVTISPSSPQTVGTELTANYDGTENVTLIYQWYKSDGAAIPDADSSKYTPSEEGRYYVTVRAKDYTGKTSPLFTVTARTLSGTAVTISPSTGVQTGTVLTAAYNGSEKVNYQWFDEMGAAISGANTNKYTPTEAGRYYVTVSLAGYNTITSYPGVEVTVPPVLPVLPVLSSGIVTRKSDTEAVIGFTTNAAGTAYYRVEDADAKAPTSAEVISLSRSIGTVSGTVSGKAVALTAGEKDIYVVVEDGSGNVSAPLKIAAAYNGLAFELISGGANNGTYRVRKGAVTGGAVVIPASYNGKAVTEIGAADDNLHEGAFYGAAITGVTIPASVKSIGKFAFVDLRTLKSVTLPNGLTAIGEAAFEGCTGLKEITVPTSVTSVGYGAFSGWKDSQTVNVPFASLKAKPAGWNKDFVGYGYPNIVFSGD